MHSQGTDHHVFAIPSATVFFEDCREIGLVSVANNHAAITKVIHKQVDTNKSMHQRAAGETRCTIHMNKLT